MRNAQKANQCGPRRPDLEDRATPREDRCATAIVKWLLATAQLQRGQHAGAVAGTFSADGSPDYVYPEIAGYHLSWLAFLASLQPERCPDLSAAAEAIATWIAGLDGFAGRVAVRGGSDWRAGATFSFDLAMIVAGLDSAGFLIGGALTRAARERVFGALEPLCAAELVPCVTHSGDELPETWSTRPGPYQLKAAALLARCVAAPPRLRNAAQASVVRWRDSVTVAGNLHPLLYACEGLFLLGDFGRAAGLLRQVLRLQRPNGSLPETVEDLSSAPRADVLAQALRLATALGVGERAQCDALEAALRRHVGHDGAVRFSAADRRPNVWCAQFAHQALSVRAGAPLHPLV